MSISICEALYREAEDKLHADYIYSAKKELQRCLDARDANDTREWMIFAQARMDAMRDYFSEKAGLQLRRITIDIDAVGYVLMLEKRRVYVG